MKWKPYSLWVLLSRLDYEDPNIELIEVEIDYLFNFLNSFLKFKLYFITYIFII